MYEGIVQDLIEEFGKLPGIGPKSAQRITFHVVQNQHYDPAPLAELLAQVRERVKFCTNCSNVSEHELCSICSDPRRDESTICVVEEPKDIVAIERTRQFHGLYQVLGGAINPIDGIGPDNLNIHQLLQRLSTSKVSEIIIATDPNIEGEATAAYLTRILDSVGVRVSRLASGLPVGSDLEFADEVTLGRAFEGRKRLNEVD